MRCFPMPYPPPHHKEEGSRTPLHDRLGPRQSGLVQHATPVRPIPDQLDQSHQRPVCISSLKQEYHIKEKKEEIQPATSLEKAKADEIV